MEYADNGTLQKYLKEHFNNLTWNDKFNLALQLAYAVSCLHDEGIVHRDLVININYQITVHNPFIMQARYSVSQLKGQIELIIPSQIIKMFFQILLKSTIIGVFHY